MSWLDELKRYDKVIIEYHDHHQIGVVDRVTKTLIIVNSENKQNRYNRFCGAMFDFYSHHGWRKPQLREWSVEKEELILKDKRLRDNRNRLEKSKFKDNEIEIMLNALDELRSNQ